MAIIDDERQQLKIESKTVTFIETKSSLSLIIVGLHLNQCFHAPLITTLCRSRENERERVRELCK